MNRPEPTERPYCILVAVDYSEVSALALTEAVNWARIHEHSHIHVVHCIAGMPPLGRATGTPDLTAPTAPSVPEHADQLTVEMSRDMQAHVEQVLAKLNEQSNVDQGLPPIDWTAHLRLSDPTQAIVQLAADVQADLVVVGTHGRRGFARFLLGSVAESVVRLAPCPVLVVHAPNLEAGRAVPQIEPPCPECLSTRQATRGEQFWCERHRSHHERAHTYHFTPFRDAHQFGLLLHPPE